MKSAMKKLSSGLASKLASKKALASILCVLALAGAFTSCGGRRRLSLRVGAPEGSAWYVAAEGFRDRVEKGTHFKLSLRADASPGSCDLELDSLAAMAERMPGLAAVSAPWLFPEGYESVDRLLLGENSAGRGEVFAMIRDGGLEPLGLGENGFFQLTCDVRALTAPEDLTGLSLTAPADGPAADFLRTLGAEVEVHSGTEAFPALQDAALEGQTDTLDGIRADQSYLVQRYMTVWNCAYDPICLTISGDLWSRLSPEDRQTFRTAAQEACAEQVEAARSSYGDALESFREAGVEVMELESGEIGVFRALAEPVYEKWRTLLGDDAFAVFGVS